MTPQASIGYRGTLQAPWGCCSPHPVKAAQSQLSGHGLTSLPTESPGGPSAEPARRPVPLSPLRSYSSWSVPLVHCPPAPWLLLVVTASAHHRRMSLCLSLDLTACFPLLETTITRSPHLPVTHDTAAAVLSAVRAHGDSIHFPLHSHGMMDLQGVRQWEPAVNKKRSPWPRNPVL